MSSDSLRVAFAGTPAFAATSLAEIIASPHQVVRVYTQPDRPQGRGRKLIPSPVKACGVSADIPVSQPERLDAGAIAELQALNADLLVVVAYGLILPPAALQACRFGAINVHASLLPRWRGAAPIQRAIQAGDPHTGVTIMQMDEGLDTGPMLAMRETEILGSDTGGSLHDRLAQMGAGLLIETLNQIAERGALPVSQEQDSALACYAHKLEKVEAAIDWNQSAQAIERMVRAFNPWPIAFTQTAETRVRILSARVASASDNDHAPPGTVIPGRSDAILVSCGDGALEVSELQLAGGKPITARQAKNGHAELFAVHACFGTA